MRPAHRLAAHIFRKRLLIEGFFTSGYDSFVPLIDSGIYVGVWSGQKFLSIILYTCADFDDARAVQLTREFFQVADVDTFAF